MEHEGYQYLDVRSVPEFDQGHPRGAFNVPLAHPGEAGLVDNAEFVREVARCFRPDDKLVVGCASGVRSVRAVQLLEQAGFSALVEQRAGIAGVRDPFGRLREKGWQDEGLPVAQRPESGRSYREITAPKATDE